MKKICVITQTYSDNRIELFNYHNLDENDNYFRNKFDGNIYTFHNLSDEYYETLIKMDYFKNLNNLSLIRYNNISYPQTFKKTLSTLIKQGYEYVMFLQDDVFTITKDKIIYDEIYDFIQNNDFDMLNLETEYLSLNTEKEILHKNSNIVVYNTDSSDYVKRGWFSFDDGPYIAKIEYIHDNIYDDYYFNYHDIWSAENYLNSKVKNIIIQRFTFNKAIYRRFNLIGPNNWDFENDKKILEKYFYEESDRV
jgi:hypothetical protein